MEKKTSTFSKIIKTFIYIMLIVTVLSVVLGAIAAIA